MSIEERPVAAGLDEATPPEAEGPVETVDGSSILLEESDFRPLPRALPVEGAERVGSVDVIRGVALMGILAMNIVGFGWPGAVYSIPIVAPEYDRADLILWGFNHLVFDTKMMTLFSMLFGAGLVLMSDRAEGRGAKMAWVYYRRVSWLLVIGLVHSYLIWDGDILVMYASVGFLLYPTRKWSPRTLIIAGVCLNLLLVPLLFGFRFVGVPYMRNTAEWVEFQERAGDTPSKWDRKVADGWKEMSKSEMPKEDFLKQVAIYRGATPGSSRTGRSR